MEKLYIQDDHKRKRLAERTECALCKTVFLRAKKGNQSRKCCSKKCADLLKIQRISLICTNCGVQYERVPSKAFGRSKNNVSFCSNKCKYSMQTLDCPNAPALPKHYGTSDGRSATYRRRASSKLKIENGCGCGEKRKYLLMIHHIDGNRANNVQENLECVCGNCHMIRHLSLTKDGEWEYKSNALTPRELIHTFTQEAEPE